MKHATITLKEKSGSVEILEGMLVKEDEKHVTLKLGSGYNIGISRNRIEKIALSEIGIAEEKKEKAHIQDAALPKILILHTGGTIASKVDYKTGAVIAKFDPNELLGLFPEIKDIARIESKLISNMMSDDMRFSHYNIIAKAIAEEIEHDKHHEVKGIIITHGTDTLHNTSAALAFILENIDIPIVLVGSQRSSDRGSSDSAMNMISAVAFAANTTLSGVFICMHESINDDSCLILNGINARKMHSSRRDAFKPINIPAIARVNYSDKGIEYLSELPQISGGKFKLHLMDEHLKIGILVSHPNMFAEEITLFKDFDGLVLEGTGLGHFPITELDADTKEHLKIKDALKDLCKKMPVVMSLQTIYGTVNMNVYSPGRELIEMGVIGNLSTLTPETSFIKLAWLLSQKLDPKEWFMKDLRGEMALKGNTS